MYIQQVYSVHISDIYPTDIQTVRYRNCTVNPLYGFPYSGIYSRIYSVKLYIFCKSSVNPLYGIETVWYIFGNCKYSVNTLYIHCIIIHCIYIYSGYTGCIYTVYTRAVSHYPPKILWKFFRRSLKFFRYVG